MCQKLNAKWLRVYLSILVFAYKSTFVHFMSQFNFYSLFGIDHFFYNSYHVKLQIEMKVSLVLKSQ